MMRMPKLKFAATGTLVAIGSGLARAQSAAEPGRYADGPHMMWPGGGWGMIFGPVYMILVLAVGIALAAVLVRWLNGGPFQGPGTHQLPPGRTALDILKERYARGEIDKQEFEERRHTLAD